MCGNFDVIFLNEKKIKWRKNREKNKIWNAVLLSQTEVGYGKKVNY